MTSEIVGTQVRHRREHFLSETWTVSVGARGSCDKPGRACLAALPVELPAEISNTQAVPLAKPFSYSTQLPFYILAQTLSCILMLSSWRTPTALTVESPNSSGNRGTDMFKSCRGAGVQGVWILESVSLLGHRQFELGVFVLAQVQVQVQLLKKYRAQFPVTSARRDPKSHVTLYVASGE